MNKNKVYNNTVNGCASGINELYSAGDFVLVREYYHKVVVEITHRKRKKKWFRGEVICYKILFEGPWGTEWKWIEEEEIIKKA